MFHQDKILKKIHKRKQRKSKYQI